MSACLNLSESYVPEKRKQNPYLLEAGQLADRLLAESQQAKQREAAQTVKDRVEEYQRKNR
jgi:hypothetical protein